MSTFLMMWATTMVVSKLLKSYSKNKVYKEIMNMGYKIDKNKVSNFSFGFAGYELKILELIPLVNLFVSMMMYTSRDLEVEDIIEKFKKDDSLKKITLKEEQEYYAHPSIVKAKEISLRDEPIIKKLSFDDITIIYEVDYKGEIEILSVVGDLGFEEDSILSLLQFKEQFTKANEKVKRKKK